MKKIIVSILSLISLFALSTVACAYDPDQYSQDLKKGSEGRVIIVEGTNPGGEHLLKSLFEEYLIKCKTGY